MEKKYLSLKTIIKMLTSQLKFIQESVSNGFGASESKEVSLKGNVYDFSDNSSAIEESDILSIHNDLMIKNNMK